MTDRNLCRKACDKSGAVLASRGGIFVRRQPMAFAVRINNQGEQGKSIAKHSWLVPANEQHTVFYGVRQFRHQYSYRYDCLTAECLETARPLGICHGRDCYSSLAH